jgi:hypothetical protein
MAASVPRFLRQARLAYLPLDCVIGSRAIEGDNGENLIFDVIVLPEKQFQRMKTYVGLQNELTPVLAAGPIFEPSFILTDTKTIAVPEDESNAQSYARNHFMIEFDLVAPSRK